MLVVHIAAGAVALIAGGIALFTAKGRSLHRRSGRVFAVSMLVMGLSGALIAALTGAGVSVLAGFLASYFAVTAWTTVRAPATGGRALDLAMCLLAFALAAGSLGTGAAAVSAGRSALGGVPVGVLFAFGVAALLSGIGDARRIRSGGLTGAKRLRRHLWRMCVALFIASGSFFLGQADEFPKVLRIPALLAIPAFLPLGVMLYWLWRVRGRRHVTGAEGATIAPGEAR
jgi:uncharacterized membrane protein